MPAEEISSAAGGANAPSLVSIDAGFERTVFLAERTPATVTEDHIAELAAYRDGTIAVAHFAGRSEWERHGAGDEIVLVLDGETTLVLLVDGEEVAHTVRRNEFVVVPKGTWHRFEAPDEVKLLGVTPKPTEHRTDRPD
jgi:mannose-6-phosphate isomerase-like protein (cupin superfamily)